MSIHNQNSFSSVNFLDMNITTFQYKSELEEMHDLVKKTFKPELVSDIYESPISYSFRIYNPINKVTHSFYQAIKDDAL